jgi:hypothetical protein
MESVLTNDHWGNKILNISLDYNLNFIVLDLMVSLKV